MTSPTNKSINIIYKRKLDDMTSPTNKSINIIYKRKLDDMTSPTKNLDETSPIYINENQMI